MRRRLLSTLLVGAMLLVSVIPAGAQDEPTAPDPGSRIFLPAVSQPDGTINAASRIKNTAVAGNGNLERGGANKVKVGSAFIVQMIDAPVVAYTGDIAGYPATKPAKGQKIDPLSPQVVKYAAFLESRQDQALAAVGGARKLYSYRYAFNGFAADLTEAQAAKMLTVPGVVSVSPDEMRTLDTSTTPAFLGLTKANGLWKQLGGVGSAGENIIIGIVDGGIWPEHPSFSDRTGTSSDGSMDGKLGYQQVPGWNGKCTPGEEFTAANCNQKLVGAQYFNQGWGGNAGIDAQLPWEYNSPRDFGGHGTHTASTAGGNANIAATGPAAVFGSISGMAPRARIAAYKVCWETGTGGSCASSDSVAAIDQAVADGVDVINFSISGSLTSFMDPVEIAFLFAADAGVFVAASAGNDGPDISTIAHPGPWMTTVAAGTHNRAVSGSVTLGNNVTYNGASVAAQSVTAPLIDSTAAGLPGADPARVALCYAAADNGGVPVLDPAVVAGKIVICDRGVTDRVNKSLAVQEAGGLGMVLVNTSPNSINADFHFVPTVHVPDTNRKAIKKYATRAGATATINPATFNLSALAPYTADFSSRGPILAGGGDLLKPDMIAPGQDVLAAVAPPGNSGRLFDLYSGTSMASPHVAGLAALLKDLHPDWSPMMIKSALMTSAYDVLGGSNTDPGVIFSQGAGHVRPNSAADPGLVFDAGWNDWYGFLCGTGQFAGVSCPTLRIDPSDLNVASIAIGDLAGSQTVTRKLTNVGSNEATYSSEVFGVSGIEIEVSPSTFTIEPGKTQAVQITLTRTDAPLDAYTGGNITWSDGSHSVRIPVVVRPVAIAVPAEVRSSGDPVSFTVKFGYTGDYATQVQGLVAATTFAGTVADDPTDNFVVDGPGTISTTVPIPAGMTYARFSLFDNYVDGESDDLDLYVYKSGVLVGASGGGTSDEEVNLLNPVAGEYIVWVHGWGTDGPEATFTQFTWLVPSINAGNVAVTAPDTAVLGQSGTVDLSFSGLAPATKYLGVLVHQDGTNAIGQTVINVSTPPAAQ